MKRKIYVWKAATVLLIGMLGFAAWYAKNASDKNDSLIARNANLERAMAELNLELNEKQLLTEVISDLNLKKIILKSKDTSVHQFALVFWNTTQKSVYVDVSQLPKPLERKQYQLWVVKAGLPINLGLVDYDMKGIQRMKNAADADAFEITLEDMGGKPTPTLEQLTVFGKVLNTK